MPEPIIDPTTIAVELNSPSRCTRCGLVADSPHVSVLGEGGVLVVTCCLFYRKLRRKSFAIFAESLPGPNIAEIIATESAPASRTVRSILKRDARQSPPEAFGQCPRLAQTFKSYHRIRMQLRSGSKHRPKGNVIHWLCRCNAPTAHGCASTRQQFFLAQQSCEPQPEKHPSAPHAHHRNPPHIASSGWSFMMSFSAFVAADLMISASCGMSASLLCLFRYCSKVTPASSNSRPRVSKTRLAQSQGKMRHPESDKVGHRKRHVAISVNESKSPRRGLQSRIVVTSVIVVREEQR